MTEEAVRVLGGLLETLRVTITELEELLDEETGDE